MNKTDQMNSSFKDGTAKSRPKLKSRIVFPEKIKIMNLSMSDNYEEIPQSTTRQGGQNSIEEALALLALLPRG